MLRSLSKRQKKNNSIIRSWRQKSKAISSLSPSGMIVKPERTQYQIFCTKIGKGDIKPDANVTLTRNFQMLLPGVVSDNWTRGYKTFFMLN